MKPNDLKAFLKEMMQAPDKFKAGATSLEVIKNIHNYLPGLNAQIIGFETIIKSGEKFRLDILVKGSKSGIPINILIDTKNYKTASGMFGDLGQLKAYFSQINSFEELLIIQQKGRFGIEHMQNAFQTALKNANKNNKLFDEIIWKNKNLSRSLFGVNKKPEALKLFNEMIEKKNSKLYNILKLTE